MFEKISESLIVMEDLLYLHRSYFARAMNDHPKDPLGSPYGTSVIAAYRSAGSLVALMRNLHTQLRDLSERIWFLWAHMFSCSVSYTLVVVLKCSDDYFRLYWAPLSQGVPP